MDHRLLEHHARAQHGLVTKAQAHTAGMSRSAWYRALDAGALVPVHPGIARLPGATPTDLQTILAAALWRGAAASHGSAALVWGARVNGTGPVDLIVPRDAGHCRTTAVRTHHPSDLEDLRISRRAGVPVTNPLRTLVDLGATDPAAVPLAFRDFVIAGFVTPRAVAAALERHQGRGRSGVRALREALADWRFDTKPPDSALESEMRRLLDRYGLPAATFHPRVAGFEVDFLIDRSPIVVECDGWATHGRDREQFEFDRRRDAALAAAGFVVLHVTWRSIVRRPSDVAASIRDAVHRWAPELVDEQHDSRG